MANLLYPIPWMKYLNASVSFAGCKHTEMLIYDVARLNIFQILIRRLLGDVTISHLTSEQNPPLIHIYCTCIFLSTCIRFSLQNLLKLGIVMRFHGCWNISISPVITSEYHPSVSSVSTIIFEHH